MHKINNNERGFLKTLIQTIPDLVWLKDPEGIYLACNSRFEQLYGVTEAELIGKTDYDFVAAELADVFRAHDRAAQTAGQARTNEEWLTFAQGGYRGLFETTKTPMWSADGHLIGILGIAHDITAAREASARRDQLMKLSRDGIAIINQDHQVIEANPRYAQMLGYQPEEVPGLYTWQIDANMSERDIRDHFADLSSINITFESQHRRKDGSIYDVEVSASGTSIHGNNVVVTVCRDISERKAIERALRESEARLHTLFRQIADGIVLIDVAKQSFVEFNDAACQALGYSREEFAKLSLIQINPAFSPELMREALEGIMAGGGEDFETLHRHKDGSFRNVQVSNRLVHSDGRDYLAAVWTDITQRKAAETAQRDTELRWKFALEGSGLGVWDWNVVTGHAYFSPLWLSMLGYTEGDFAANVEAWHDLIHPDEMAQVNALLLAHFRAETTQYIAEFRMRHKLGWWKWVQARGLVMDRDSEGQPKRMIGVHIDIQARKRADEKLRESETALNLAQQVAQMGSWQLNIENDRLTWSDETYRLFGLPRGAPVNFDIFLENIHPEDRNLVAAAWNLALQGVPYDIEHRIQLDDGEIWVRERAQLDFDEGRPTFANGTVQNITDLKQSQAQLAESEERYRILADYSTDWQYWLGSDGRYIYVSPGCETISGYSPQAFLDNDDLMRQIIHPEDLPLWDGHWHEISVHAQTLAHAKLEFRVIGKDGNVRWIEHQCQAVSSHKSEYRGRRGVNRDITDRMNYQVELQAHREHLEALVVERTVALVEARQRAEMANQSKSTFLANMSHEIRTPLNAIIGLTHILRRSITHPKQLDHLDKVGEAGRHLLGIINDVLDISKIEAGKMQVEVGDFHLERVVSHAINLIRDRTAVNQIKLRYTLDSRLPAALRGDSLRLGQVLLNFISNAVKFTEQGSVSITVAQVARSEETVRVRFEIADTGIGMTEEQIARLFNAFEQADSSTTRKYGGTGLGLAISKRLIELMGGRGEPTIGVSSEFGQGSRFWFELPFRQVAAGQLAESQPALSDLSALKKRQGLHILLAEDNLVNQEVAKALLDEAGLAVDVAENGAEVLRLMAINAYDLVLMDVQMPVMDGLLATRALRAMPTHRHIPILAMTANVFAEDRQRCLDAGMDDHIAKPVDPDALYLALNKWLPAKSMRAAASATPVEPEKAVQQDKMPDAVRLITGLDAATGLQRVRGNWTSYARLLNLFAENHHDDIVVLRQRLAAGEREEACRIAHSLKGAAGSLGVFTVQTEAGKLEHAVRNGVGHEVLAQLADRVEKVQGEFVASLRKVLSVDTVVITRAEPAEKSAIEVDYEVINELDRLLREDDMRASDALREAVPMLAQNFDPMQLAQLRYQVGQFDYPAALKTLRTFGSQPGTP